jgi:hypothetical protein
LKALSSNASCSSILMINIFHRAKPIMENVLHRQCKSTICYKCGPSDITGLLRAQKYYCFSNFFRSTCSLQMDGRDQSFIVQIISNYSSQLLMHGCINQART